MKDYSAMSDFELSVIVGNLKGVRWADLDENYSPLSIWNGEELIIFDPCNSWADAGPIIEKQRITIAYDGEEKSEHPCAWVNVSSIDNLHSIKYQHPDKTLRAAMIIFLMMQEGK